jgi:hypothetical protein
MADRLVKTRPSCYQPATMTHHELFTTARITPFTS